MKRNLVAGVFALAAWALAVPVEAQTAVNRKAVLTWNAPTQCASGAAITQCAVSGYTVEKLTSGVWLGLANTAANVLTYTDENLAPGTYTYRVYAQSSMSSPSLPSNVVTKSLDSPGAPGNLVITITVTITP